MKEFTFSEEATLFAREFDVVEEIRKAWRNNLDQFHQLLFSQIASRYGDLERKTTAAAYRYWWRAKWERPAGVLKLWQPLHYPELIRDRSLEFHVYFNQPAMRETIHPILQLEAGNAFAKHSGITCTIGNANSERPLTLKCRWEADPLGEGAQALMDAMDILDGIVGVFRLPAKGE